ncbi:MAG: TrmH family RNA methyltransferase [Chlamydiales bacterium]|jgi:TrmH family RNA methyltransferase
MAEETPLVIRSRANATLKRVAAVFAGKRPQELVLEGDRLVDDALRAGLEIEIALVAEGREDRASELEATARQVVRVERALLDQLSQLKTSPGLMALCSVPRERTLDDLRMHAGFLMLVIAGVADPGNLGALARSAEAAGADAIAIVKGGATPWSDKVLRGSMGSLLRLPVVRVDTAETLAKELEQRGIRQCVAATRGGTAFGRFDWSGPLALWVGSETGDAPQVCESMEQVTIAMAGEAESLNVTVATSILLFATGRNAGSGPGPESA